MDPQVRYDELLSRLKERGYRLTPQRLAVLKVLAASENHPSVAWIYERVRAGFPTTGPATVYKAVVLLKEMGQVLELRFGASGSRYDGQRPHPHPHLVCVRCGAIEDLDIPSLSQLPQEVSRSTGYSIVSHRLDVSGICPGCQASPAGDTGEQDQAV